MTQEERRELYKKALSEFGIEAQIIVAIEELSELIKELTKYLRGEEENIDDEIADVEIMIEQLVFMFDNREMIEKFKQFKLKRLANILKRIDEEKRGLINGSS